MSRPPTRTDDIAADFDTWFWGDLPAPTGANALRDADPPTGLPPTDPTTAVARAGVSAASAYPTGGSVVRAAALLWDADGDAPIRDDPSGEAGAGLPIFANDPVWKAAIDVPVLATDSAWQMVTEPAGSDPLEPTTAMLSASAADRVDYGIEVIDEEFGVFFALELDPLLESQLRAEPTGFDPLEPTAAMLSAIAQDAVDYGIEEINEEFGDFFALELDPLLEAQLTRQKQPTYQLVSEHNFDEILDHAVAFVVKRYNLEEEVEADDLLMLYLRDIYRIPLLSAVEEVRLTQSISTGRIANKQLEELGYQSPVPNWAASASSSTVHVSTFGREEVQIADLSPTVLGIRVRVGAAPSRSLKPISRPQPRLTQAISQIVTPAKAPNRQSGVTKKAETTPLAEAAAAYQSDEAQKTAFYWLVRRKLAQLEKPLDRLLSDSASQGDSYNLTPSERKIIEITRSKVTAFYKGLSDSERVIVERNHLYRRLAKMLSKLGTAVQEQERKRIANQKAERANQARNPAPRRAQKKSE